MAERKRKNLAKYEKIATKFAEEEEVEKKEKIKANYKKEKKNEKESQQNVNNSKKIRNKKHQLKKKAIFLSDDTSDSEVMDVDTTDASEDSDTDDEPVAKKQCLTKKCEDDTDEKSEEATGSDESDEEDDDQNNDANNDKKKQLPKKKPNYMKKINYVIQKPNSTQDENSVNHILITKAEQRKNFKDWRYQSLVKTKNINFEAWQSGHSTREAYFFGPDNVS